VCVNVFPSLAWCCQKLILFELINLTLEQC